MNDEKKSKHSILLLGAAGVEDAKRFVAFVLEASERLGPDAATFFEYLQTLCRFPILRFECHFFCKAECTNDTSLGAIPSASKLGCRVFAV